MNIEIINPHRVGCGYRWKIVRAPNSHATRTSQSPHISTGSRGEPSRSLSPSELATQTDSLATHRDQLALVESGAGRLWNWLWIWLGPTGWDPQIN